MPYWKVPEMTLLGVSDLFHAMGQERGIFQSRNRDTDVENRCMDTRWGSGGGMDWEIEIDIYTLLCIK